VRKLDNKITLEEVQTKTKLFLEGIADMKRRLDVLEKRVDEISIYLGTEHGLLLIEKGEDSHE